MPPRAGCTTSPPAWQGGQRPDRCFEYGHSQKLIDFLVDTLMVFGMIKDIIPGTVAPTFSFLPLGSKFRPLLCSGPVVLPW